MSDPKQPKFKTWIDKGGNIGIQCLDCNKTHWTGKEDTIDLLTKQVCPNCEAIKGNDLLAAENSLHQNQCVKGDKPCPHTPSQR